MSKRILSAAEIVFIIVLAAVPLFVTFPYRVNIFLSWEGAYRISQGQLPFRDFGTPLGGMYWVIPGIFFKIFGPQMITLVKAQVFINVISGLAFRSICKGLSVPPQIRFVSVIVFCLSYSFFNFWPWYNHSVIVYELVALAFLFKYINSTGRLQYVWLVASALFVCFSFLTKQDGGGMALLICLALLAYHCLHEKRWSPLLVYAGAQAVMLLMIILPLSRYGFGYWFNHGQPPHTARISPAEITNEFFGASQWIKFYLFLIVLFTILRFRKWKELWNNKKEMLLLLLTLAMLVEAAVFQVTSYTPPDNNIFFHSFAIVFILSMLSHLWWEEFERPRVLLVCTLGVVLWWSSTFWRYIQRVIERALPSEEVVHSPLGENVVNRQTYTINTDTSDIPVSKWEYSSLKSFKGIYMPKQTVEGIDRLMNMDMIKSRRDLKVLNMSELTPLAVEIPYQLERNQHYPLWFHLGVGMFNREAEMFEKRLAAKHYDLVLFEYVPTLNNFYPFRVRDSLKVHYKMVDSFIAPRRGSETKGTIEVYVR